MRYCEIKPLVLAGLFLTSLPALLPSSAAAAPALSAEGRQPAEEISPPVVGPGANGADPGASGSSTMPSHPVFGLDGASRDPPPAAGRGDTAPDPQPAEKAPTRAEVLDKLLGRLAKATDPDEAQGIAGLVEQIWMKSGSDTADLLMSRVVAAINDNRHDVAEALLGQILELRPDWAEAWNKRATLRFLDDDDAGSMEDISHVLALEPRHFGALSGMGFILARHGEDKAALTALRRALEIYPENADVRKAVDRLTPEVEGHDL